MLIGAIIAGLLTAVLVQWFHSGAFSGCFHRCIYNLVCDWGHPDCKVGNAHLDTKHALMGEITFVPWDVMRSSIGEVPKATFMLATVLLVVLIVILAFYKEWKITSFDPALAPVSVFLSCSCTMYLCRWSPSRRLHRLMPWERSWWWLCL